MKTPIRRSGRFKRAGLASAALATALLTAIGSQAGEKREPLVLTAYINAPGGESLVEGEYEAALQKLDASKHTHLPPSMRLTNLCVAHAIMRHWGDAQAMCDAAVKYVKREQPRGSIGASEYKNYRRYTAIAYANRAVVHWMSSRAVAAAEDLAKAHSLAPEAEFVARNLQAFRDRSSTIARVGAAH